MEVRTPERQPPFDSFSPDASRKHTRSLDSDDDVPSRHKHRGDDGGADKHRSSGEKHKHKEDREERSSKHKHKHHKHKRRRKHRKEHPEASVDEIGSDKDDGGVEKPGREDAQLDDPKGDGLGSEFKVFENSNWNPNCREDREDRDLNESGRKGGNLSGEDNLEPDLCTDGAKVGRGLERIVETGKPDCGQDDMRNFGEKEYRCEPGSSRDSAELEKSEDEYGKRSSVAFCEHQDSEKLESRDELAVSGADKLMLETRERIDRVEFYEDGPTIRETAVDTTRLRKNTCGFSIESNQIPIALDDEKEEGEILEEEETNLKPSESDIESGEIKTEEFFGREDAGRDEISSEWVHSNEIGSFPFSQVANANSTNYERLPVEKDGTAPVEEKHGKAVHKCTPAPQSMLGIAQAYDSDQGSEDDAVEKRLTAGLKSNLDLALSEVEVGDVRDEVEVFEVCRQTKPGSFGINVSSRAHNILENDELKPGLNREMDKNDCDTVGRQSLEQELNAPPSPGKFTEGDSQAQAKREGQDESNRNIRKDNQSWSRSSDCPVGKKRKHRSRSSSRDGERMKEVEHTPTESVLPGGDTLRDDFSKIWHAPVTEEIALQGSGPPDAAIENMHKRKWSSLQESVKDRASGRKRRSNSQESENDDRQRRDLNIFHPADSVREKGHTEVDNLDHKRRSRSRESDLESRQHRDSNSLDHFDNSKYGRSRVADAKSDRRSRSREGVHNSKHLDASCEKRDQSRRSRSKEPGHRYRSYQDGHERSDQGSRLRSREAIHDLKNIDHDRCEKSERGREAALDLRYAKRSSERSDPDSRYSRHSSERSEWVKRSKQILERNEQGRRSRSREAAQDSRHSKDDRERNVRGRRSKSREALYRSSHGRDDRNEQSWRSSTKDNGVAADYSRRSRSRDASQHRVSDLGALDRRRRSKSPESFRGSRDNLDKRRRSRSRESLRDRRDNHDWRRRSRSRESSRDRRLNAMYRYGRRFEGSAGGSHKDARVTGEGHSHSASLKGRGTEKDLDRGISNVVGRDKKADQSTKDLNEGLREEENQEEYQERVASQLAAQEDEDLERIKEERRRRRQAILEKYNQQQKQPQQQHQLQLQLPKGHQQSHQQLQESNDGQANLEDADDQDKIFGFDGNVSVFDSNGDVTAYKSVHGGVVASDAAIDPQRASADFTLGKGPLQNGLLPTSRLSGTGGLGEGTPKSEKSNDLFCDYIFGESPAGGRKLAKGDGMALETSGLTDNWDDAEGYYCYRIGEVLDGRYEIAASHGRGVFSSVVRARDLKASRGETEEIAIKIIRNNDVMFKTGQQEHVILKKLAGADPENRRHCVRYLSSFEYRNHLCLVFESLHMNLREILKKFGRNIGINLNAVRAYAKQLFIALKHLKNCGVLHCDIKPDNMLVNEAKNVLKLCDFGSAMFAGENEITPYLVSRFYRAPEIILGLSYDHALDIWSVGCCLYEFYTGKVIFPGPTNNDMLRLHMELKGSFPKKMLKKAGFAPKHFDQDYNFCSIEDDPVTKTTVKRVLVNVKPKDIGSLITGLGTADEDPKMLGNFKDMLEKIFILDPDKRLTVSQALNHPFITGK